MIDFFDLQLTPIDTMPDRERRIDPVDGGAYTFKEMFAWYQGRYTKKEVREYWEKLTVKRPRSSKRQQVPISAVWDNPVAVRTDSKTSPSERYRWVNGALMAVESDDEESEESDDALKRRNQKPRQPNDEPPAHQGSLAPPAHQRAPAKGRKPGRHAAWPCYQVGFISSPSDGFITSPTGTSL